MLNQIKRLFVFRDKEHIHFSYVGFITSYLLQSAIYLAVILYVCNMVSPSTFQAQFSANWQSYLGWFVGVHFFLSFFEWFYHRYILHFMVWIGFKSQCDEHTKHHGLTDVTTVLNEYPIEHSHQTESATFPWYALAAFWGIFTPVILTIQWFLPTQPVMISGYLAITFSLILYEVYHAVMHLDYDEFWKQAVKKSKLVKRIYGFHLMHHANIRINQAIGGFFFFPIWDRLLGTYFVPLDALPLPGKEFPQEIPTPQKPIWVVRRVDEIAKTMQKRLMLRQRE